VIIAGHFVVRGGAMSSDVLKARGGKQNLLRTKR
jgi:hypothetical protein